MADHAACWARAATLTDPAHVQAAARLRTAWQDEQRQRARAGERHHADGHRVPLRVLTDYDALFGVDFDTPTPVEVATR